MDAPRYLRRLMDSRLAAVRGPEPDSTALYHYELKGAANALVAAGLLDAGTAKEILDEWHRTLEDEGLEERWAIGVGFHGEATASRPSDDATSGHLEGPDRLIRADPIHLHIMDVDGIGLVADGLVRFRRGFELRVAFVDGDPDARVQLLQRMTRRDWGFVIRDSLGNTYRETGGHGGPGAYTLRFQPAIREDAQAMALTVTADSGVVAEASFALP